MTQTRQKQYDTNKDINWFEDFGPHNTTLIKEIPMHFECCSCPCLTFNTAFGHINKLLEGFSKIKMKTEIPADKA